MSARPAEQAPAAAPFVILAVKATRPAFLLGDAETLASAIEKAGQLYDVSQQFSRANLLVAGVSVQVFPRSAGELALRSGRLPDPRDCLFQAGSF